MCANVNITKGYNYPDVNTLKGTSLMNLKHELIEEIKTLAEVNGITKVILFGSRARGDNHRTSDIDLAVTGRNYSGFSIDVEEETNTLLRFDCVNLDSAVNEDLMESIKREGVTIYEKS